MPTGASLQMFLRSHCIIAHSLTHTHTHTHTHTSPQTLLSPLCRGQAPASGDGVLGLVPHQLRGSLNDFSTMILSGHPFDKCTACSPRVQAAYAADPRALLAGAMNTPKHLDTVCGLAELDSPDFDTDDLLVMSDDEGEAASAEGDDDM